MTPPMAFVSGVIQGFALGIWFSIWFRLLIKYLRYRNRTKKLGLPKKKKAGR